MTRTCGARRASVVSTSCNAAPAVELITPIARGNFWIGRLRSVSNSPAACRRARWRRNSSYIEPAPRGNSASTTHCNSPRGS